MRTHDDDDGRDLGNLVRRLRRFGERWPWEEPTAEMCREAADELERLVAEVDRLHARLAACGIRPTGPDQCAHGIDDGEYCLLCNAEYKRGRAENDPDEDG